MTFGKAKVKLRSQLKGIQPSFSIVTHKIRKVNEWMNDEKEEKEKEKEKGRR